MVNWSWVSVIRLILVASLGIGVLPAAGCSAGDPIEQPAELQLAQCPGPCCGAPPECRFYSSVGCDGECECTGTLQNRADDTPCSGGTCQGGVCCRGCVTSSGGCLGTQNQTPTACGIGGVDCASCVDANPCNGQEFCQSGTCQPGMTVTCADDGNPCTNNTCTANVGCNYPPNTATCNDGNACTTGDVCSNRSCTGTPRNCNDSEVCTDDSCDPATGCQHVRRTGTNCTGGKCLDGACCTGCISGTTCQMGTAVGACGSAGNACQNCVGNNPCKNYNCSASGACTETNKMDTTACMVSGTAGQCRGGNCCTGCWNGTMCVTATSAAACGAGGGACSTCSDSKPCTSDVCSGGACIYPAVQNGTSCADSNLCNGQESCQNGNCAPGTALDCNDTKVCTTDSCNAASGCAHVNNTVACNDGDACTANDVCGAGQCRGAAITCNDNEPCTTDTCLPATGCKFTDRTDGTTCDDGNPCSSASACTDGTCTATAGLPCNDTNPCTRNSCASGACVYPNETDGIGCNDNDACTEADQCTAGRCGGARKNCDDDKPCTKDSCDPVAGCTHQPDDAAACSDGNPCTDDRCSAGTCVGTARSCPPADECHEPGPCEATSGACSMPGAAKADSTPCQGGHGTCRGGACVTAGQDGGAATGGTAGSAGSSSEDGGGTAGSGAETGSGGNGGSGTAGSSSGGGATTFGGAAGRGGDTDSGNQGGPYVRNPGGCACRAAGDSDEHGQWALFLAGVAATMTFYRRRSRPLGMPDRRAARSRCDLRIGRIRARAG